MPAVQEAPPPAPVNELPWSPDRVAASPPTRRRRLVPVLVTLAAVALAAVLGYAGWGVYMEGPWTRDGTVRAYVATVTPEVSGNVEVLAVADNQFVHKGDLLLRIDPVNYRNAVHVALAQRAQAAANLQTADAEIEIQQAQIAADQAELDQAAAALTFAREQAERYRALSQTAAGSVQSAQQYTSQLQQQQAAMAHRQATLLQAQKTVASLEARQASAAAAIAQATAHLDQAQVDLARTELRSPVDGWVVNLLTRAGDFAEAGRRAISVVDADSFWVDAYLEETGLGGVRVGDAASIGLMGYRTRLRGHVASIARAISVPNAAANAEGVATVNPVFTWVRLAQRIPVRISIDEVPAGVTLAAGMTATVRIVPGGRDDRPTARP